MLLDTAPTDVASPNMDFDGCEEISTEDDTSNIGAVSGFEDGVIEIGD